MLTPMDIHAKEFSKSFRGFDENEVNDFLNEVMQAYASTLDENEHLRAELAREREKVEDFRRIEQSVRETLVVAQKTAEDTMTNAKQNADHTLELAAKEAQNLRREATLQAKAQLDEAADKVRAVVAEYERLVREKHQFLRRMKGNVQAELALIEDAIAEMPDMVDEKKAKSLVEAEGKQSEEDV
ncbi:DivIVA domain-containing protein [Selenomonas sp. FOBRC6]|uniref:DivIVA domain-containing protein n=1 Tax=Selenomonas sp. FOBRC6 TaxID=936572 RepID=UPI00056081D2|nr:DivIVA domain-containing protein [Selenomonas sp. FOBRC6]